MTNTEFSKKTGADIAKNTLVHTRLVQFVFLGKPVIVFANVLTYILQTRGPNLLTKGYQERGLKKQVKVVVKSTLFQPKV